MNDVMSFLEKVQSLLRSRRFWLFVAQAIVAIIAIAVMIAPIVGVEIGEEDIPEEEALADRLMAWVDRFVKLIGGVLVILNAMSGAQELTASYTARPPGSDDRKGLM